ncbi:MAG: GGDEF domain-containing protein, partial [Guyparkeria sp.]|uniref:GGDEF domain-containing protein n=1 Tax=Guyparkeria sp. TaxID=2035736 RepID=UPI00397BDB08
MQTDSQVHSAVGEQDTIALLCDASGRVIDISPGAAVLFPENGGRPSPALAAAKGFHLDDPDALYPALAGGREALLPGRLHDHDVRLRITPLGEDRRLLLIEDAHRPVAHIDSLTGLPDRSAMIDRIREAQADDHGGYRLLLADIDRLKTFNDYLGNPAGDHLIRKLAAGMRSGLPREILVSRWSGHEFMLLIPPGLAADTGRIAEQLREIARSIRLTGDGSRIGTVTLSMGHAAVDPDDLSRLA